MSHAVPALAMLTLLAACVTGCVHGEPLRLHPHNPHYFQFRGKPTILISSAEHYGAVLNSQFDFTKYLDTLAAEGMNHTRLWVGGYCEPEGALNIERNTLAPGPGKLICPWARSDQPGYANGGNKFDLMRWDDAFFTRLRNFVGQASDRGVVVEVNLFCPFYTDEMWAVSPMNVRNNINGLGTGSRRQPYTLDQHAGLLPIQEAMIRKVVAELRDFDNLYYEVMNEPYVCKVPMDWQRHMLRVIQHAQRQVGDKHLISMNIANEKEKVDSPLPGVSILNFHYAWPPDAVTMNYGLGLVIGENETGGIGGGDYRYRREGWAFVLAGGGLYSNLDYSFTVGHEDGTFVYPPTQPGGGSRALRRQLHILSRFINRFDFLRMKPDRELVQGSPPGDLLAFALLETGQQYAIYLCHAGKELPTTAAAATISIALPPGRYELEWINPSNGDVQKRETLDHAGGMRQLLSPAFQEDVALRAVRT